MQKFPRAYGHAHSPIEPETYCRHANHKKAAPGQPAPLKAINSIAPEQKTGAIREQ